MKTLNSKEHFSLLIIFGLVFGYIFWFFGGRSIFLAIIGCLIGILLLDDYFRRQQEKRLDLFNAQLADMLTLMANGLRAGYSNTQAIKAASKQLPPPISEEFARVVQEMQTGLSMEAALDNLLQRMPSAELDLAVAAMRVQREMGGNPAEILDAISRTIRERVRIKGEINVLTSAVRHSGHFLAMLPGIICLALWFLNRPYMMLFFDPETRIVGIPMVILGTLMILAGSFVMTRIVNVGDDSLRSPLAEYSTFSETISIEEIDLFQSFSGREIDPLVRKMAEIVRSLIPLNILQQTEYRLELAGNPRGLDPILFWATRFITAIALGCIVGFVLSIGGSGWPWSRRIWITALVMAFGFYLPELLLSVRIRQRQKKIRKAMPDVLDFLTLCVAAGLSLELAIAKVYWKWNNELSVEFGRVLRAIQQGKSRQAALRDMAGRIGVAEMTSFVTAVIQGEQLGASTAVVLRIQTDRMRGRRRLNAEVEAHSAPVKMLLPMIFFIFPSSCIFLMTPAILMLMRSAFKGILFGG